MLPSVGLAYHRMIIAADARFLAYASLSLSLSLSLFPFWPQNFPVYGTPITTTTTTTTTEYTYPSHNSVAEVVELRCTRKACVGVLIPLCEVFD